MWHFNISQWFVFTKQHNKCVGVYIFKLECQKAWTRKMKIIVTCFRFLSISPLLLYFQITGSIKDVFTCQLTLVNGPTFTVGKSTVLYANLGLNPTTLTNLSELKNVSQHSSISSLPNINYTVLTVSSRSLVMAFKALRVNINSVKMTSKHKRRLSLAGVKAMSCVWCCDIYTAKQHVLHSFFISLTLILLLPLQEESFETEALFGQQQWQINMLKLFLLYGFFISSATSLVSFVVVVGKWM